MTSLFSRREEQAAGLGTGEMSQYACPTQHPASLWREETSILVWHGFAINILIEVWMMVLISADHSVLSPPRSADSRAQVIRCNYWLGKVARDHPAGLTAVPVMSRARPAITFPRRWDSTSHISQTKPNSRWKIEIFCDMISHFSLLCLFFRFR